MWKGVVYPISGGKIFWNSTHRSPYAVRRTLVLWGPFSQDQQSETFYKQLFETITENDFGSLLLKPHLIFNCDESGFEFEAINKIVAAARGAKHVPRVSNGQHKKVTVLVCASAAGNSIPPMFIFKSPSGGVPNGIQEGSPAGTLFAGQKSGWIEKDLFLQWFKELFLKCIPPERPVLLLVDGHKAHVTAELIETATANKVLVFCLPAHSSHLLQPLDLSLFGPLKRGWVQACAAFSHVTCTVINQRNFAKIFNIAWSSSVTPDIIRGGFRRSGIYPYDPSVYMCMCMCILNWPLPMGAFQDQCKQW